MKQLYINSQRSVSCYSFGESSYERDKIFSVTGINVCHDNTGDTEIITQELKSWEWRQEETQSGSDK